MAGVVQENDQLIYVAIAQDRKVLAEAFHPTYARHRGRSELSEIATLTAQVVLKLANEAGGEARKSLVVDDDRLVHYMRSGSHVFLVVAATPVEQARAFVFLQNVVDDWGDAGDLDALLQRKLVYYSNPNSLRLTELKAKTVEVGQTMRENLRGLVQREESISLLQEKAASLEEMSVMQEKAARSLRWNMLTKNMKLNVTIVFILLMAFFCLVLFILIFIYILLAVICGGITLDNCRG